MSYEVVFTISGWGCETKTYIVDVTDTGNEKTNKADAILAATLELDDEGITEWSIQSVTKI